MCVIVFEGGLGGKGSKNEKYRTRMVKRTDKYGKRAVAIYSRCMNLERYV